VEAAHGCVQSHLHVYGQCVPVHKHSSFFVIFSRLFHMQMREHDRIDWQIVDRENRIIRVTFNWADRDRIFDIAVAVSSSHTECSPSAHLSCDLFGNLESALTGTRIRIATARELHDNAAISKNNSDRTILHTLIKSNLTIIQQSRTHTKSHPHNRDQHNTWSRTSAEDRIVFANSKH
jgi:hypothetical protein